jgi:hypothetical protein
LYYWKQWNAARRAPMIGPEGAFCMADGGNQPRTRRRNLLALGADPATVHMATRSRKGYWRMSQNEYRGAGWTGANATCPEGVRAVRRRASNCAIRAEQPLVGGTRSSGYERPGRCSAAENPRSLTAWTQSKPSGSLFTSGRKPESDWNRPVRSRTQGGVGPGS